MHTQHMPHIMIVNRLEANKERIRPECFDQIRPHSIRSLQFDQKVRPLSFRPDMFDLFTATYVGHIRCMHARPHRRIFVPPFDAHFPEKNSAKCPMLSAKWDSPKWDSAKRPNTCHTTNMLTSSNYMQKIIAAMKFIRRFE